MFWQLCNGVNVLQANERLHEKLTNFISKNKAAQLHKARFGQQTRLVQQIQLLRGGVM
jgi:syntaxin-binding protein 1